ncbi:MAG: hypothetical protein JSU70_02880, partial [Phycisphaerales bacterium]
MIRPKPKLNWVPTVIAALILTSVPLEAAEDSFCAAIGSVNELLDGSGSGYEGGRWRLSSDAGWWNQWFVSAPFDPGRKRVMELRLLAQPLQPELPCRLRIAYRWSTHQWWSVGKDRPPLPEDGGEWLYVKKHEFFEARLAAVDKPIRIEHHYEIQDYNPEWVSVELQGENVAITDGTIKHWSVSKDRTPYSVIQQQDTEACCFEDGSCADLSLEECKAKRGVSQGVGTKCLGDRDEDGIDDACEEQPETEACCFEDGSCADLSLDECNEKGGTSQGPGTECLGDRDQDGIDDACEEEPAECAPSPDRQSCMDVACPRPTNICVPTKIRVDYRQKPAIYAVLSCECLSPNQCQVGIDPPDSVYCVGGCPSGQKCELWATDNGDGTVDYECRCIDEPEPTEACCFEDGSCADLSLENCNERGGISQGPGTECLGDLDQDGADDACEEPSPDEAACCLPDGSCTHLTPTACVLRGGNPQGPGARCENVDCPQPVQACCLPDGTCVDETKDDCLAKGGTPQGIGTDCATADCPGPAECDWDPGDPHKMHWPQEPDFTPSGLTYPFDSGQSLADDFLCTATGPIRDIHIWGGFLYDVLPFDGPGGVTFELAIYSNAPADSDTAYSRPRWLLWSRSFGPGQYTVREVYDGPQTFLQNHLYVEPILDGHYKTYQYNFCIEDEPFTQEEGTIYWLEVKTLDRGGGGTLGWKTTSPDLGWEDAAVLQIGGRWHPRGPEYMSEPLNFAFVITGVEGSPPPPQACCLPDG